jgi:hypothetical protein
MKFELSNTERKYLGLCIVKDNWELVEYNEGIFIYYENNMIRKCIFANNNKYCENELNYETAENRTILLPKTQRGKTTKITPSVIEKLNSFGTYFRYQDGDITIGNYTNQRTYYTSINECTSYKSYEELKDWLNTWVHETSESDLKDIEEFSKAKVMHCKYQEGDFFRFKIGRRKFGFGRILLNVEKIRKTDNRENPNNYGFSILMGKPLIVKIYHFISNVKDVDLDKLKNLKALPSEYIMDNIFYYGECEIIGNVPLLDYELDFPMQYGRSISYGKENDVYFQWGLEAKISKTKKMEKFIKKKKSKLNSVNGFFSYNGIGWSLQYKVDLLSRCISENSNKPYWESDLYYTINQDLRNPKYDDEKKDVLEFFFGKRKLYKGCN